jgi:cell division ATPase FtsA
MRNRIQIAFDLGSHSIKSAAGRILPNGKIEVLSIGEIQSKSIDCGDIVDKDLLLTHLEILVEKMEKDAKINKLVLSAPISTKITPNSFSSCVRLEDEAA